MSSKKYLLIRLESNMVTSQARLDNLEGHLGLVGGQFNVAVSILNVGYVPEHSFRVILFPF